VSYPAQERKRNVGRSYWTAPDVYVRLFLFVALLAILQGCGAKQEGASSPLQRHQMRGEVIRLDANLKVALIKHEDIAGWMKAMTMEFPVKDQAEFNKLKIGDRITATVFVRDLDYWIGEIQPVAAKP